MNTTTIKAVAEKLIQEVPTISVEDALHFAEALVALVADSKTN